MEDQRNLFNRWFVTPLSMLQSLPNGDGGFIALATCFFLYERYAKALQKKNRVKADTSTLVTQLAKDFDTDRKSAEVFWSVVRDGILHQGMPKQRNQGKKNLPGYILHHSFSKPFELVDWGGEPAIKIQPWCFVWKVVELCEDNFEILVENNSFPFPKVM